MQRYGLGKDQWERIKSLLLGNKGQVGRPAADNRLFVEAVLYRYRVSLPWRELPKGYGDWKTSIGALAAGPAAGCGNVFLSISAQRQITNTP
jgi:transposase